MEQDVSRGEAHLVPEKEGTPKSGSGNLGHGEGAEPRAASLPKRTAKQLFLGLVLRARGSSKKRKETGEGGRRKGECVLKDGRVAWKPRRAQSTQVG